MDVEVDILFREQISDTSTYGLETHKIYELIYNEAMGEEIKISIRDSTVEVKNKSGTLSLEKYFKLNEKEAVQLANMLKQFATSYKEKMQKKKFGK